MLSDVEGLVSGKLHLMKMIWSMFKLETRLAGLSVYPLLIHLLLLLVVFMSSWLSLLGLGIYFFTLTINSLPLAIVSALVLNVIILVILTKGLKTQIKNMSFENTRHYFSNKEVDDEQTTKTINSQHSNIGATLEDKTAESINA